MMRAAVRGADFIAGMYREFCARGVETEFAAVLACYGRGGSAAKVPEVLRVRKTRCGIARGGFVKAPGTGAPFGREFLHGLSILCQGSNGCESL